MANKTIGQLTAKTTPASADVFALEDTEDTKKINYDALADAILNKITSKQYTVAGSSQTLINAINTLNSNLPYINSGTIIQYVKTNVAAGKKHGSFLAIYNNGAVTDTPSNAAGYFIDYTSVDGTQVVHLRARGLGESGEYIGKYTTNDSAITWILMPTRGEVDALKSKYYAIRASLQSYTFNISRGNTGDFWFALMYIGTGGSIDGIGLYEIHINTSNNVTITKIAGDNNRTFTGTLSGNELTITASATVYGGIRVLMLDI